MTRSARAIAWALALSACTAPAPPASPPALLDATTTTTTTATATVSAAPARGRLRIDMYPVEALDRLAASDRDALERLRRSVERISASIAENEALFRKTDALSADDRELALDLFAETLGVVVALDAIARFNFDFFRVDPLSPVRQARHFLLAFTAYVLEARLGFELISRTLGKGVFERLLDEGSPERGVPLRAYERLKWNVVHISDVGRIYAAREYHRAMKLTLYKRLDASFAKLIEAADRGVAAAKGHLREDGARMFKDNGLDLLKDGGHVAWIPVQTGIAELMGDTRVRRRHEDLIGPELIEEAVKRSRPGDLILERRNWYLSNVGLPGFWPHAALYLGSPSELAAAFDVEPTIVEAFGGPFTTALARRHPKAWAAYVALDEGHAMRLIEAMSEGVVFTSAEHSLAADYAAALRPRLAPLEIAQAIDRAFAYHGRPYDFDFDFRTDRALVCSELVYKAYEPRARSKGLRLELARVVGRPTLPPNTLVAQFDRELDTPVRQLDFVWFLDASESERRAFWSDEPSFRRTHARPKWDVAQR